MDDQEMAQETGCPQPTMLERALPRWTMQEIMHERALL